LLDTVGTNRYVLRMISSVYSQNIATAYRNRDKIFSLTFMHWF
jgi:hypothetical protein